MAPPANGPRKKAALLPDEDERNKKNEAVRKSHKKRKLLDMQLEQENTRLKEENAALRKREAELAEQLGLYLGEERLQEIAANEETEDQKIAREGEKRQRLDAELEAIHSEILKVTAHLKMEIEQIQTDSAHAGWKSIRQEYLELYNKYEPQMSEYFKKKDPGGLSDEEIMATICQDLFPDVFLSDKHSGL